MTERNDGAPDGMDRPLKIQGSGASSSALAKRFYKEVTVVASPPPLRGRVRVGGVIAPTASAPPPSQPSNEGEGELTYAIHLDGRPVRTPAKSIVAVPTEPLAHALAEEWRAQAERIDPRTMPLTRLINSGLDGVAGREAEVAADIVKYAGSDLLCYRAEHPAELIERQSTAWDTILGWAGKELGVPFAVAAGIIHVSQSPELARKFGERLEGFRALQLAALHVLTTISGSAVLALAIAAGRLSLEDAWSAAHVDEDWQIEKWGEDAEAAARRQARWTDFAAAAWLLALLR